MNFERVRSVARIFFFSLAALFFILLFVDVARGSDYRYPGLRSFPSRPVSRPVSLDTARTLSLSHVAVWVGADKQANRQIVAWVQGGVFKDSFSKRPQAYIETFQNGNRTLRNWPVTLGQKVRVALGHLGDYWQVSVSVGGHAFLSRFIHLSSTHVYGTMEIYRTASGIGHVGTRRITSW